MFIRIQFLTQGSFVNKHGMVVHHHEHECHTKSFVCHPQGQDHSEVLIIKILLSTIVFSTASPFVTKFRGILWKNYIAVFKVKVTTD